MDDFERLEFLGDQVLRLALTEILMEKFPKSSPGDLTHMRETLGSHRFLVKLADKWGVDFEDPHKNVSDSVEAVLGAQYKSGGIQLVKNLLEEYFPSKKEILKEQHNIMSIGKVFHLCRKIWGEECEFIKGEPHEMTLVLPNGEKIIESANSYRVAKRRAAMKALQLDIFNITEHS